MSSSNGFGNKLACWIARCRPLLKLFAWALPPTGVLQVTGKFRLHHQLADVTGPSFYVNYGGPAAFYHYEESEKAEILQFLPADGVFVDAGANIGLFSFFLARYFLQARIYAFEPHPVLFGCLNATQRENGLGNVTPIQACVGDRDGSVDLHLHRTDSGGHSTSPEQFQAGQRGEAVRVPILKLDTWASKSKLQHLDVLKVDIQGGEWDLLEGARRTIRRFGPMVLMELDNAELVREPAKLKTYFDEFYQLRVAGETNLLSLDSVGMLAAEQLKRGRLHSNYVFLPGN